MTDAIVALNSAPEPRRRNRPVMERALIDAATALFAERGYDATTTRAVGERVGCSEALIQNYFGGKEGLLLAVMRSGSDWDAYTDFFRRPLCPSMEQEATEHLNHVVRGLAERTHHLRILLSRALADPAFRMRFGELTLRTQILAEIVARLERYGLAGMLRHDLPLASTAELLVDMGFQLGFAHPQLDGHDGIRIAILIQDFAQLFARAVQLAK